MLVEKVILVFLRFGVYPQIQYVYLDCTYSKSLVCSSSASGSAQCLMSCHEVIYSLLDRAP